MRIPVLVTLAMCMGGGEGEWRSLGVRWARGIAYRFKMIVTASLPHVSVAWSPATLVMVPSMRIVDVEGWAEGAKDERWEGRIRGVVTEVIMG